MNNYEWIKELSLEDLAHFCCSITDCDHCPVFYRCHRGLNGFKEWLEAGHEKK